MKQEWTARGASHQTSNFLERVTSRIAGGQVAVGTIVTLGDFAQTEILCTCGYDFVWIDTEHSALDKMEVNGHILAARSRQVAPFVRVAANDPVLVKPLLDMGPAAIVFPQVNTSEAAARAVAGCRYPPTGIRGFAPARANMYGAIGLESYLDESGREPWVVLQIEHRLAVENLESICAVEGVDALLVGPFDLSASIGRAGMIDDPEVIALMDRVGTVALSAGIPFGAFTPASGPGVEAWLRRGASWLAVDTDVMMLTRSAHEGLSLVQHAELAVRKADR